MYRTDEVFIFLNNLLKILLEEINKRNYIFVSYIYYLYIFNFNFKLMYRSSAATVLC